MLSSPLNSCTNTVPIGTVSHSARSRSKILGNFMKCIMLKVLTILYVLIFKLFLNFLVRELKPFGWVDILKLKKNKFLDLQIFLELWRLECIWWYNKKLLKKKVFRYFHLRQRKIWIHKLNEALLVYECYTKLFELCNELNHNYVASSGN